MLIRNADIRYVRAATLQGIHYSLQETEGGAFAWHMQISCSQIVRRKQDANNRLRAKSLAKLEGIFATSVVLVKKEATVAFDLGRGKVYLCLRVHVFLEQQEAPQAQIGSFHRVAPRIVRSTHRSLLLTSMHLRRYDDLCVVGQLTKKNLAFIKAGWSPEETDVFVLELVLGCGP